MNSPPKFSFKRSAVCLWYYYSIQLWICLDRKRGVIKSFILPSRKRIYNKVENPPFSHFYYGCRRLFAFSTKKSSVLSYIFGAERQKCIKRVKKAKIILDKRKISCYNIESRLKRAGTHQATVKKYQKSEKTFKKGIDKWEMMWYNIKVAAKKRRRTVIENWTTREKYKAKK